MKLKGMRLMWHGTARAKTIPTQTLIPAGRQGERSQMSKCVRSPYMDRRGRIMKCTSRIIPLSVRQNPYTETVDFLEELVLEFISDMTKRAMDTGKSGKVQIEDIIFLVRNNPKMYSRIRELITMNVELKKARKAFDDTKYAQDT